MKVYDLSWFLSLIFDEIWRLSL